MGFCGNYPILDQDFDDEGEFLDFANHIVMRGGHLASLGYGVGDGGSIEAYHQRRTEEAIKAVRLVEAERAATEKYKLTRARTVERMSMNKKYNSPPRREYRDLLNRDYWVSVGCIIS